MTIATMTTAISVPTNISTESAAPSKSVANADSSGAGSSFGELLVAEMQENIEAKGAASGFKISSLDIKNDLVELDQDQALVQQNMLEQFAASFAAAMIEVRPPTDASAIPSVPMQAALVDTLALEVAAAVTSSIATTAPTSNMLLKSAPSRDELVLDDLALFENETLILPTDAAIKLLNKLPTTSAVTQAPIVNAGTSDRAPAIPASTLIANSLALDNTMMGNSVFAPNLASVQSNFNEVQLNTIAPAVPISVPNFAIDGAEQIIRPRVGEPNWDQAVGQKINWMVNGGHQSASLTLNPPDLGPLQVVIHVNNQQADATFISHQPEVRAALENAVPKLREIMDQAGIQLGECNINSQTKQHQEEFAQRQASSFQFANSLIQLPDQDADLTSPNSSARGGTGLVDTFA